jgi:hypothetical protein
VLTLIAVLGGGAAFAHFENDREVTTDGGRIIAICLMVTGVYFVAVLTAAAAERFVRPRREEEGRIEERLDHIIAASTRSNGGRGTRHSRRSLRSCLNTSAGRGLRWGGESRSC